MPSSEAERDTFSGGTGLSRSANSSDGGMGVEDKEVQSTTEGGHSEKTTVFV